MPGAGENQHEDDRPDDQDAGSFKFVDVEFGRPFFLREFPGGLMRLRLSSGAALRYSGTDKVCRAMLDRTAESLP
jgi:hypothetical protein